MDLVRATAQLPGTTLEGVEAAFAERVTSTAVFCATQHLTSGELLEVGNRVELEVVAGDGAPAFVCRGVVAWLYAEDAVPAGREAGVGILVAEVIAGSDRFARMAARAGAGGRVRLPGARVLQRLRIEPRGGTGVVVCAPRDMDLAGPTPPSTRAPTAPLPRTMTSVVNVTDDTDSAPAGEVITPALAPPVLSTSLSMIASHPPADADDFAGIEDALGALDDDVPPGAATTVMFVGDDVILPREAYRADRHVEVTRIVAMPRSSDDLVGHAPTESFKIPPVSHAAGDSAAGDSAAGDSAAGDSAIDEGAADESPVDESPVDESPVDESPVDDSPVDESPVDESPVDESPVDEGAAAESAAAESAADESAADESAADESAADESAAEVSAAAARFAADESAAEVSAADEDAVDEPALNDVAADGASDDGAASGNQRAAPVDEDDEPLAVDGFDRELLAPTTDQMADVLHEPTLAFADDDDFADADVAEIDDEPGADPPGDGLEDGDDGVTAGFDEPPADIADRLKVLSAALHGLSADDAFGLDGPTLDGESDEGPAARPMRSSPTPRLGAGEVDLSALEELSLPLDVGPGHSFPPPTVGANDALILDLSDVSAFPEAPELPIGRPFEAQSTDVDLLASISAGDLVPIDGASQDGGASSFFDQSTPRLRRPPVTERGAAAARLRARAMASSAEVSSDGIELDGIDIGHEPFRAQATGLEDLPSMEADLLDGAEAWPDQGADAPHAWSAVDTELFTNRRLPEHDGFPAWSDLLDARTIGAAFSWTRRGLSGLEFFAWPLVGTKRYSGVGQGESSDPRRTRTAIVAMADFDDSLGDAAPAADDDGDVFSAPSLSGPAAEDPFGARSTDPRLNVEGLVARHVRASHQDADTAVFDTPDLSSLDGEMASDAGSDQSPDVALDSLSGFAGLEPDVTRDEMQLPRLRPAGPGVPTKALADPLSGTDSGEGL